MNYQVIGECFVKEGEKLAQFLLNHEECNASSLGRVYQHIKREKHDSFGIITAYRDANPPSKNKANFHQLKSNIRSLNLGFFVIQGIGQEEDGGESIEPSLFIPGITLKTLQKLMKKYKQYGVIYSGPETKGKIVLFTTEGKHDIGSFHPMKISQYFSKVKGKPFVFSHVEGNTHLERYAKSL